MAYHNKNIPRGKHGEFSKIKEEFLEAEDAFNQNNKILTLSELSDLIGAIEGFCNTQNITLEDLIIMKNATQSAFDDGTRTPH